MTRAAHEALLRYTHEGLLRYFGAHELLHVESSSVPLVDPATSEPYADAALPWLSLRGVLERASDPAALVTEAWRVAREGVVLAAPWCDASDASQRAFAELEGRRADPLRMFDAAGLRALLPDEPEALQIHHNGFRTPLDSNEVRERGGGPAQVVTWPEEVVLIAMKKVPEREGDAAPTANEVTLEEVKRADLVELFRIAVRPAQRRFVAGVVPSLAQSSVADDAWCGVVRADGKAAGFVMLSTEIDENDRGPWLWRFLVDARYQGLGVGRRALGLTVDLVRQRAPEWIGAERWAAGPRELWAGAIEGPGTPLEFYRRQGFEVLDEYEEGERLIRLPL